MSEENDSQDDEFDAVSEHDESDLAEESPSQKKSAGGLKFLTFLMLILAVGVIAFPFIWGLKDPSKVSPDSSLLNDWLNCLGDLHVVVLHIPIGIFVYIFAMETLGILSFGKLKPQLRFALFLNAITAVIAVVFGYFYFLRGSYGNAPLEFSFEENKMGMHMWLSILFAAFVILSFVCKMWAHHQQKWSPVYPLFLLLAAASMVVGAHMGGELVHTDKDIVGDLMKLKDGKPLGLAADEIEPLKDVTKIPAAERLVVAEVVMPILQDKCWECHAPAELNPLGKDKMKGDLDMTTVANLIKGGKNGDKFPTLVPGDAANSDLIGRTNLDVDDDEFMPKGSEDHPEQQFTEGEKRILTWWADTTPLIDEENDKPLGEVPGHESILDDVKAYKPVGKTLSTAEDDYKKETEKKDGEAAEGEKEEPSSEGALIGATSGQLGENKIAPTEQAKPEMKEKVEDKLKTTPVPNPNKVELEEPAAIESEESAESAPTQVEGEESKSEEPVPAVIETEEAKAPTPVPAKMEEAKEEAVAEEEKEEAAPAPTPPAENKEAEETASTPTENEESATSEVPAPASTEGSTESAPASEKIEEPAEVVTPEKEEVVPVEPTPEKVAPQPASAPTPTEEGESEPTPAPSEERIKKIFEDLEQAATGEE